MSFSSSARSSVVGCLLSAGWAAGLTGARAVFSVWAKQFTFSKRRFPINRNAARSLRPRRSVAKLIREKPQVMDISTLFTLPRAALLKSHEEPLLCATSVFSVSLWLMNSEQKHTTETQRTQRLAQRNQYVRTFCAKPECIALAQKSGNHCWVGSVQGAVATWSVISMRYF